MAIPPEDQDSSSAPATVALTADSMTHWTFLTNHAYVLVVVAANPGVILRQIASLVGITERAVQRIIQELESGGFVERERVGRQNRYRVHRDKPLRHPIEAHRKIGDLLDLIEENL